MSVPEEPRGTKRAQSFSPVRIAKLVLLIVLGLGGYAAFQLAPAWFQFATGSSAASLRRQAGVLFVDVLLIAYPLALVISIVGTIVDASSGQAVPSATVVVGTNVRNVVASDGGKFTLEKVPIGNQTLVVRAIGYTTETETILVTTGNTSKAGDGGLIRLQSTLTPASPTPHPQPS